MAQSQRIVGFLPLNPLPKGGEVKLADDEKICKLGLTLGILGVQCGGMLSGKMSVRFCAAVAVLAFALGAQGDNAAFSQQNQGLTPPRF